VQWLAEVCIRRPVFALMLTMALIVSGAAAYLQLGIDRFPKIDLPTVVVTTLYYGSTADEIETEVTQIIEDAVATVAGIDELRSVSSEGRSEVIVTFNLNRSIDAGTQDIRDAVGGVLNRLPPGVDPPVVRKQDLDASPILTLAVAGQREARELYVLADRFVKNVVESAPGVGQALVGGTSDRAVQVNIEARRLAAYHLSIMQVRDALERQNAEIPGGRVDIGKRELGLRTPGRFVNPRDFLDLVVASNQGAPVRLRDLGEVVDGQKEVRNLCRLDGKPAVVVQVQRQSGTNTVEVIEAVKSRLQRARRLLPADVTLEIVQDQSRYIKASLHEVQFHLIGGSILASLVVLLFMRSWRATLIAAVAIPASIIATFCFMRFLGFTLNNVTMLALVLMVGVVIDDAIVVLENVFHCIEEKGMDPVTASREGTREIGLAVLATTLSLVIVFLPVSFLSSITGRLLYEFGITASVSILVSMFVSFSLTPMMCSRLLKAAPKKEAGSADVVPASRRGFYHAIEVGYDWCLRGALRYRWVILILCVLTIAANWPLYKFVKQDYIPTNVDEGEFEVGIAAPEGISVSSMDETMAAVEKEVRAVPGVKTVLMTMGSRTGRVSQGGLYVRLDDIEERTFSLGRLLRETLHGNPLAAWQGNYTQREKMIEIRRRLSQFTDLRVAVRNQTALRQGAPVDIDFVISGPELMELAKYSDQLRTELLSAEGIVDADTTLRLDRPELVVQIDRERAAALGVDVREIADTLRVAVGGDDRVSRFRDARLDGVYDVELRLVGIDRASAQAIGQLYVRAHGESDGTQTRLDNLVRFRVTNTPARIDRVDRQRMAAVRANVAAGAALGDRLEFVRQKAEAMGMPPQYSTRVLGRGRELERTFRDFAWTFILSFLFMYIILAAQFEHLVHPLTILVSLPLAVPFGLISLWLGRESLNLYSAVGILVLFGVIKKASILQVDHTNQLREKGLSRTEAILRGNRDRLRPILMTTVAFVAGMAPLLLGTGPGAEERRSIAVLALGGQTLSLLLTLLAVPVVYTFLDDLAGLFRRRATVPEEKPAEEPAPATPIPVPVPVPGQG
jgi:HAE1 family hydrophobic/amphiphilic exporter-1